MENLSLSPTVTEVAQQSTLVAKLTSHLDRGLSIGYNITASKLYGISNHDTQGCKALKGGVIIDVIQ